MLIAAPFIIGIAFHGWIYQIGYTYAYLFWRFLLNLKAFDQRLTWALFSVLILLIVGARIIKLSGNKLAGKEKKSPIMNDNRLSRWIKALEPSLANKNDYFSKWLLSQDLFALYSKIMFESRGINQMQLKKLLRTEDLNIPIEIREYLQASYTPYAQVEKRSIITRSGKPSPLDLNPERMVKFLEEQNAL